VSPTNKESPRPNNNIPIDDYGEILPKVDTNLNRYMNARPSD